MDQYEDFVEECTDDGLAQITVEMLVGARFLSPVAARPRSNPKAEAIRQEAIHAARKKYARNIAYNAKTLEAVGIAAEYEKWFEVFNGEKAKAAELAINGTDPANFQHGLWFSVERWKARAQRAAAKKGILWEMLHASKDARERRILRVRIATPEWVDYDKISAIYKHRDAMNEQTGIVHHVDHIVPLAGRNATGLHVHDNLQVITAEENMAKLNKYNDWR